MDIGEQRRVGGHGHDIGIAFQADHERRFADGRAQVSLAAPLGDRIFTDIDPRTSAIVSVILAGVGDEEFRVAVVMLVDDLDRAVGRVTTPNIRHNLQMRIAGLDRVVEQGVAFAVGAAAVFVANLDLFQIKRRGVAIPSADRAPAAGGRPVGVFDGVERILHPRPHLVHGHVLAMRHAAVDDE